MADRKSERVSVEEALQLTELIAPTLKSSVGGGLNRKLLDLLYAKVCNHPEIEFLEYFNVETLKNRRRDWYQTKRPDVGFSAMSGKEPDWFLGWIMGVRSDWDLNYSGEFTYDCQLISMCYKLYNFVVVCGGAFEEYMGDGAYEQARDIIYELEDIAMEYPDEPGKLDGMTHLLAYGACYIESRLSGVPMREGYLGKLLELFREYYPSHSVSCEEYFDSFFNKLNDYYIVEAEPSAKEALLPFYLDACFGQKMVDGETTPSLYFYTSKPLKEYQVFRDGITQETREIKALDTLRILLEDPLGTKRLAHYASMYETEVIGVMYEEEFSSLFRYTDNVYLGVYYYFELCDEDKYTMEVNPFFELALELFEVLFDHVKKQGVEEHNKEKEEVAQVA